jgi:hypothetical protein
MEEKDPVFDDFISGVEGSMPHFEEVTSESSRRRVQVRATGTAAFLK